MTSIKLKFRPSALQEKEGRNKTTVFNFIRQQISQLRVAGRHSTADHYAQTLSSLMRFRCDQDLSFETVTPMFALTYETWLRSQHLCRNSSSFYLRNLRSIYNKAVAAGLTTDSLPFQHVYTGIDKTAKRALYVARHSWASIAQSSHVPIHVISGAMGHDSEVTTQIYLASIQTSQIDEANSMIIDSL